MLEIAAWAIGGALAGWLLLFVFDPQTQLSDDAVTLAIGAAVGVGINRLIRS